SLHINAVSGVNWTLRAAQRLASDVPSAIPPDLHLRVQHSMSQGMMYQFFAGSPDTASHGCQHHAEAARSGVLDRGLGRSATAAPESPGAVHSLRAEG